MERIVVQESPLDLIRRTGKVSHGYISPLTDLNIIQVEDPRPMTDGGGYSPAQVLPGLPRTRGHQDPPLIPQDSA